jgi:hypothetical protein
VPAVFPPTSKKCERSSPSTKTELIAQEKKKFIRRRNGWEANKTYVQPNLRPKKPQQGASRRAPRQRMPERKEPDTRQQTPGQVAGTVRVFWGLFLSFDSVPFPSFFSLSRPHHSRQAAPQGC